MHPNESLAFVRDFLLLASVCSNHVEGFVIYPTGDREHPYHTVLQTVLKVGRSQPKVSRLAIERNGRCSLAGLQRSAGNASSLNQS